VAVAPASPSASAGTPADPPLPPGVYSLFEERFRGSPESIREKQRSYAARLGAAGSLGPILDVGCGRGEFLALLADAGIRASGVEVNPIAVEECRAAGRDVTEADGLAHLASLPERSLGAVTALQVVEHWTPERIFAFLRAARRALAPGGILIAETINVDSLSAWKAFFLDPSHVRPVPAEGLRFLAEAAGFADAEIEMLAPLPPSERLVESTENDAKLNRLLFGPQDYALIARAPAHDALIARAPAHDSLIARAPSGGD
jgi:SAM-dependent methyltransferase